jgi:DNA-binding NarL/FixJ family response regulator
VIRILIADDHPLIRRGLRNALAAYKDLTIVGEVASGADVLKQVGATQPTVLILDITMPGGEFLRLLHALQQDAPQVRTLVLTVHSEEAYARRAIRGGASGYLTKERSEDELVAAIRRVAGGGRYVSDTLAQALAHDLHGGSTVQPHESLTNREYQIMLLLASGMTVGEVAARLRRSVKTVSSHRERLLRKMGMKTNAQLTHYAMANGLVT